MSNIFTQSISPDYTKQSVSEFFVDPMFMGNDVRGDITVRTDINGTELLNKISRPSKITRLKTAPGFTALGSFALTTKSITVKPLAIEFEQNGREFWGSVMQMLLDSGYKEDDVENMSNPDIWNKIVLPIIAQAGQQDLIRQMWFADTASPDADYSPYDGFFKLFKTAVTAGNVSHIPMGTAYLPEVVDIVIGGSVGNGDVATFTINGVVYVRNVTVNFNSSFLPNWVNEHSAALLALGITATHNSSDAITLTADFALAVTAVFDGGSSATATPSTISSYTALALATDEVDDTMDAMMASMPNEMLALKPIFRMSRRAYRNLFSTWKNLGTEIANLVQFNGIPTPHYEGIPIIVHPEWDTYAPEVGYTTPGFIVLAPQQNLLFATDGASDKESIESWYNQEEQMRRYRVQYKAATAFLHNDLLMLAGLTPSS